MLEPFVKWDCDLAEVIIPYMIFVPHSEFQSTQICHIRPVNKEVKRSLLRMIFRVKGFLHDGCFVLFATKLHHNIARDDKTAGVSVH